MFQPLLLILLAALNSTVGNILLKYSRSAPSGELPRFLSPWFAGAIIFYMLNLLCFAKALDRMPVSVGYPILAGTGFAMLTVAATVSLGETVGAIQLLGLLLVTAGIVCLAHSG